MKPVGKQLQEAREAKNWTPELAARETKIKVDRVLDLEADDYSHFTSPAYARGFVRTYALGLSINCGCFGTSEQVGPKKIIEDGSFFAFSVALTVGAFWLHYKRRQAKLSAAPAVAIASQESR